MLTSSRASSTNPTSYLIHVIPISSPPPLRAPLNPVLEHACTWGAYTSG